VGGAAVTDRRVLAEWRLSVWIGTPDRGVARQIERAVEHGCEGIGFERAPPVGLAPERVRAHLPAVAPRGGSDEARESRATRAVDPDAPVGGRPRGRGAREDELNGQARAPSRGDRAVVVPPVF